MAIISMLIGVISLMYWYFLDKPLLGIINAILLFTSFLFFKQMYEYKYKDNKKWALFSLCFIVSMFFLAGVVDIILADFGVRLSKYSKAISDVILLLICALTCLNKSDISKYIQFNFNTTPIIIILICTVITQFIISDNKTLLSILPQNHTNTSFTAAQLGVYFSLLWSAITAMNIIVGRLIDNDYLAVSCMSILSVSLAAESLGLSMLVYLGYCVVLSAVTRTRKNYIYMLFGGVLFNLVILVRISYKGLLVIPNG